MNAPRSRLAGGMAALVVAACAATAPPPARSLYDRIGGLPTIEAMVDAGIENLSADARINARFATASVPHLKRQLVDLVCLRAGGPCTYTGANMAAAHEGLFIRAEEFDALVDDVVRGMEAAGVAPRERGELLAILVQMKSSVIDH